MNPVRKSLAKMALSTAVIAGLFGGSAVFVRDFNIARADDTPAQGKVQAPVEATPKETEHLEGLASLFRKVGKSIEPAVVNIRVHKSAKAQRPPGYEDMLRKFFPDRDGDGAPDVPEGFGDENQEQEGTGSGVVMEVNGSDAYILTNNHVAGGATEMLVTLADGRRIEGGTTIGADPKSDLAIVKIKADHLVAAPWGNSDDLQKGDWIMAFGSPFGYVGSMTHGIVSALNRNAGILGRNGYENFIQVDAPINPGNSGGPLVNTRGEVVGINTAIVSKSGAFSGIGFAIPSNQAKFVYTALKTNGKVVRGWLGVKIQDAAAQPELTRSFGFEGRDGVLVVETFAGTPATGVLKHDDIITAMAGKTVKDTQELRNTIAATPPGTDVKMTVFREGKTKDVTIKIGTQPEDLQMVAGGAPSGDPAAVKTDDNTSSILGAKLATPNDKLAEEYALGKTRQGALVTEVDPKSDAAKADLHKGDVITMVGTEEVLNAKQAADAIKKAEAKGVRLYVTNPGEGSRYVWIKPSSK